MTQPLTPPPAPPLAPPVTDGDVESITYNKPITDIVGPIPEHTMVNITNPMTVPLVLKYEGKRWVVSADSTTPIPYLCAVIWFGDPRAKDDSKDRRMRMRTNELERVAAKWGIYDTGAWERIPQVKIVDMGGFELFFPALDPDGTKAQPDAQRLHQVKAHQDALDQEARILRERSAELEARNAQLEAERNSLALDLQEAQQEARATTQNQPPGPEMFPNPQTQTEAGPAGGGLIIPDHDVIPQQNDNAESEAESREGTATPDDLDDILKVEQTEPTPESPTEPPSAPITLLGGE